MSRTSAPSAEQILEDTQLGRLRIRVHPRARRLTFRTREDAIHVSVPPGTSIDEIRKAVDTLRPRLATAREQLHHSRIDLDYRLDTPGFHLQLVTGSRDSRFFLRTTPEGNFTIVCPPGTDFATEQQQARFKRIVEKCLQQRAKELLPRRLRQLSLRHRLPFLNVRITTSRSRWGSCSTCGNINLSCFLLLLPDRLADYVMLHELSHTREMNHGPRFWALLDSLTDGQAKALREELKEKKTDI